jgi:dipeptide transport system ATP-binding protein
VMYAGQVMEERRADALFAAPAHPYTQALLSAMPERSLAEGHLPTIPGMVPGLHDRPEGCLFAPRCLEAREGHCARRPGFSSWDQGSVRCHFPLNAAEGTR